MKKSPNGNKFLKVVDIFFDSLTFVSIQYILLCCMYSFRTNIVYAFFIALNASVICKYFESLKKAISSKVLFAIVFALNFVVLAVFTLMFGYLEISPALKEVI